MSGSNASRACVLIIVATTASILMLPYLGTVISSHGFRHPLLSQLNNIFNTSLLSKKTHIYVDVNSTFGDGLQNDVNEIYNVTRNSTDKLTELFLVSKNFTSSNANKTCVKRLPTVIIAGIQKCGTSALGTFLNLHPEIVHAYAEPHFFTSKYGQGYEWYKNRMPCSYPDQITIEKSPPYFYRKYVPLRIKHFNPDIKIIFIVKDPVVRSLSMYAMKHRGKANDFEGEVTHETGEIQENCKIIRYSTYPRFMKTWLDTFKREQIYFADGHNLETNPAEELQFVEKFINISSYFRHELFWYNSFKGKPCFYKDFNKDNPGCLGDNKGRKHPDITDEFRKKMENFFRPLNEEFFSMIGRKFDWGY